MKFIKLSTYLFIKQYYEYFNPQSYSAHKSHTNKSKQGLVLYSQLISSPVQFSSVQLQSVQFNSVKLQSVQFSSIQLQLSFLSYNLIHFSSIQFNSVQFSWNKSSLVQFSSVQFSCNQFSSVFMSKRTGSMSCKKNLKQDTGYLLPTLIIRLFLATQDKRACYLLCKCILTCSFCGCFYDGCLEKKVQQHKLSLLIEQDTEISTYPEYITQARSRSRLRPWPDPGARRACVSKPKSKDDNQQQKYLKYPT